MAMLLTVLSFLVIVTTKSETLNTTEDKIQQQIDAGIKFMCINQFDSNGQFLYEIKLKPDTIEIDTHLNNAARQGGGLYAIGLYYRLNHQHHNDKTQGFSITDCIDNTMRYLTSKSVPIVFASETLQIFNQKTIENIGELYDASTGATALALLGLIDICIINDNICHKYMNQFKLWIQGIITMRNHKLITIDQRILNEGAFAKNLISSEYNSAYYDSESYLALSKLLKYKQHLMDNINDCELWDEIFDIINGLDEYYIEYINRDDTHWLIQAWYNRWVILNKNVDVIDNFMNHYMIEILMKNKIKTHLNMTQHPGSKCYLVEAIIDITYAVKLMMKYSRYNNDKNDSLYLFNHTLWQNIIIKYPLISQLQMFENNVNTYFESRFNGGFVGENDDKDRMRIDDTQHCVCALMKIKGLVFMDNDKENGDDYSYMDYNDPKIDDGFSIGWNNVTGYDIMVSIICLFIVIVIVSIIFFYWCYYYPKQQRQRNNIFWLGQTMESAASDANNDESEVDTIK